MSDLLNANDIFVIAEGGILFFAVLSLPIAALLVGYGVFDLTRQVIQRIRER